MLLYIAILLAITSLTSFVLKPSIGVLLLFISKPIIDATWANEIIFGLHLTEITSVAFSFIAIVFLTLQTKPSESIRNMPLKGIWLIFVADISIFSLFAVYTGGIFDGLNLFFRHINAFVGFYFIQALFHDVQKYRQLLISLIIAGIFPIFVGVIQIFTDIHIQWKDTTSEGIVRNIGFYHDAITIRHYALQTIFALLMYSSLMKTSLLKKTVALIFGVLAIVVLYKSYSKAGVATLASWAIIWTILQRKFVTLALVLLSVIGVVAYYAQEIVYEVEQIFRKEIGVFQNTIAVERTFSGRWYHWEFLIDQWQDFSFLSQVFGSGRLALGAHNDYIQMLYHGGVLGLIIYVSLLMIVGAKIIKNIIAKADLISVGALMAFMMWMIDTIGLVPSAYSGYQWFVWGIIGLSFRIKMGQQFYVKKDERYK